MSIIKPFQLLEINVISAQDLERVSKNMRTYATAWVHPKRKLITSVDDGGHVNPTWNDKFVFRVDEEFLRRDTSSVMIEIYAVHWFRDTLIGSVRVLVGNLITPMPSRPHHRNNHHTGMRFAALQVRRPSGRPQGILNIGVAVLDSSLRSMPLYTQLSASAVGYRDLMEDHLHTIQNHHNPPAKNHPNVKPILRRSRSEKSERVTFDDFSNFGKTSSFLESEFSNLTKGKTKKGKASSVISGAELREKPGEREKKRKAKASSVLGSITSRDSHKEIEMKFEKPKLEPPRKEIEKPIEEKIENQGDEKFVVKNMGYGKETKPIPKKEAKPVSKFNGFEYGGPKGSSIVNGKYRYGGPAKAHTFWSDSEVGPSPSEVAAAVARDRFPVDDNQSSLLDGWSLDESVEGLRSKLERWRTELPPLYDRGGFGGSSYRSTSHHSRRHTDGGGGSSSGLFSCFGNICGYECQCVCGTPPEAGRSFSGRFLSPSGSTGRTFR